MSNKEDLIDRYNEKMYGSKEKGISYDDLLLYQKEWLRKVFGRKEKDIFNIMTKKLEWEDYVEG